MGLFRKIMSVSTVGAVDMRSDKERTAAYAKRTAREMKAQTKLMRAEAAQPEPRLRTGRVHKRSDFPPPS